MKINSLQTRIALFFVLLMVAVQLVALSVTHTVTVKNARESLRERLSTGVRVFERVLQQNREQLGQAARVLAADFAFREAVATGDRDTITSALENHGRRINAKLTALIGLDRRIVADTVGTPAAAREPALQLLLAEAQERGRATGIMQIDDALFQLVVVPVRAPELIGWIAIGIAVDDAFAVELKRVVGLEVSFATRASGAWHWQASTLPPTLAGEVLSALAAGKIVSDGVVDVPVGDDQLVTQATHVARGGNAEAFAILQESLATALGPLRRLQRALLVLSLVGIGVSVVGSILIARSLAKPVKQLSNYAQRIEGGDYTAPPRVSRPDELRELADAFDHMCTGLATREARILELAHRDTLTGLPNRALFQDRAEQAVAAAKRLDHPVSVLLMDLDRFKYVNDALGHHRGDLLLVEVARRLESVARRSADTIARLGGDEFAVLLPGADTAGALVVARAVLQSLEAPMLLEGHVVDIEASVGAATYPAHGEDLIGLMRHADVAMYEAKQKNAGAAAYDNATHTDKSARLSLMSELRTAVEQNQLTLYYQPKVSFRDRGALRAEALVRWKHPQRGFVAPDAFIPYAEQTGCIKLITRWVLNEAARQCVEWAQAGVPVEVSVNISARDLMTPEFPDVYAAVLRQHGCSASSISLEITESAMLDDPDRALETLLRLREQGSRLSIDDFGTGYSSLGYLKRLPVSELKIDHSFVMNMATDSSDAAIVRSTIELAHNLALKVVAEGVENERIFGLLDQLGCDVAQGYGLGRPMDAAAVLQWMRESPWVNVEPVAVAA